jgi:hypothetical protein
VGDETCACFPNKTCQAGLICASNLCVRVGGTGSGGSVGGAGSSGAAGSVGPGGSVGTGGSVGPGGSPGSGGVGPGGSVGTGGSVGPGGSPGSGGSVGLGGSLGTGGILGAGGAVGAGGSIGAGGSLGSGGTVVIGSGGAVGTGGVSGVSPPANNQILNGDFSTGTSAPWHVTVSTDFTSAVTNGQFCVTEPSTYTIFNIGWPTTAPPSAALQASTMYEFYYQISTTAPLYNFNVKVGSAPVSGSSANLTDFMGANGQGEPTAGAGLQTFAFTFSPGVADPTAGVVFLLYSGATAPVTVCIDNVALGTPN